MWTWFSSWLVTALVEKLRLWLRTFAGPSELEAAEPPLADLVVEVVEWSPQQNQPHLRGEGVGAPLLNQSAQAQQQQRAAAGSAAVSEDGQAIQFNTLCVVAGMVGFASA